MEFITQLNASSSILKKVMKLKYIKRLNNQLTFYFNCPCFKITIFLECVSKHYVM